MRALSAMNRFFLRAAPVGAGLALVAYFGFHAAYGDRGLLSFERLEQGIQEKRGQLAVLEENRNRLERRVDLVSGTEIDGDLLEEEVRLLLGWTMQDEIVILAPEAKSKAVN
jgi:cell division protein FtsB